jgi:AGCS family alanine or glycine:cation symporter
MGNIAGVAIAISIGGPGAIFWMWISALLGMATKFFEGTLAIMYKGKDKNGNTHGGPMYILTEGLGRKFKPLAIFFAMFGMIGTLCFMQANQLTESFITVLDAPDTFNFRLITGLIMGAVVSIVVLGGIKRISKIATKVVPVMVGLYFTLVFIIIIMNLNLLPKVFYLIISEAFNLQAGFGALAFIALTGARRAMYVNEAGVGTASLMHGASRNPNPVREGLVAMIGPAIDSGLVCTLTSIPILMAMSISPIETEGVKGLYIALNAFETMLPGWGEYALMVIVFIFAITTMFSYSYYGNECANYLFGEKNGKYYDYFYLFMIVVACIISLDLVVSIMDLAFALMTIPTMFAILRLSPRVRRAAKEYFATHK